jgi:anti-sigma factor RsiW
MKCAQVQEALAALVYGDLSPDDAAAVEAHLAACPSCRGDRASLEQTRNRLDELSVPRIRVDMARLYREAGDRQRRSARRWRRATLAALAAVAAAIAVAVGLRLEVRIDSQQVVVRWGSPPTAPANAAPVLPPAVAASSEIDARLAVLNQLILAVALDAESRDQDRQREVVRLRRELGELQRRTADQWRSTEQDVAALYAAQFLLAKKGTQP